MSSVFFEIMKVKIFNKNEKKFILKISKKSFKIKKEYFNICILYKFS